MSISLPNQFDQEIEQELGTLFNEIRAKKREVQRLVANYLSEEHDLQHFVSQHEIHFQAIETHRAQLIRQLETLERELSQTNSPTADEKFWDDWQMTAHPLPTGSSADVDEPEALLHKRQERVIIDTSALFEDEEPEIPSDDLLPSAPKNRQPARASKKAAAEAFRWIYHPRHIEMNVECFESRARLLNELIDNIRYDEVDILLRIPFEPEDEALWFAPLMSGPGGQEHPGARWFAFDCGTGCWIAPCCGHGLSPLQNPMCSTRCFSTGKSAASVSGRICKN